MHIARTPKLGIREELLLLNPIVASLASGLMVGAYFVGNYDFSENSAKTFTYSIRALHGAADLPSFQVFLMMASFTVFNLLLGVILAFFHKKVIKDEICLQACAWVPIRYTQIMWACIVCIIFIVVCLLAMKGVDFIQVPKSNLATPAANHDFYGSGDMLIFANLLDQGIWIIFALHGIYALVFQYCLARANQNGDVQS